MDKDQVVLGGLSVLCVGLITGLFFLSGKNQDQWEAFAAEHNCKLIEHRKGDVLVTTAVTAIPPSKTIPSGGVAATPIVATTPSKRAFKCDDGVTYWR
ncbi:hypothetical protein LJR168_003746 [Pseudoxanthomonas sp. LjRoot168]|uniref:hypothetical protein n=1 Tax=unclassified Pseudoxanthomonas TaxID=2645906 RepID=UPI003ECEFF17